MIRQTKSHPGPLRLVLWREKKNQSRILGRFGPQNPGVRILAKNQGTILTDLGLWSRNRWESPPQTYTHQKV